MKILMQGSEKKYNVYHVPDVHTTEGVRRAIDKAKKLLSEVKIIFLESGDTELAAIPATEMFANALSREEDRALHTYRQFRPQKSDRESIRYDFIAGTRKKIYFERPSLASFQMSKEIDRYYKECGGLFSTRHYQEMLEAFWKLLMSWKQLMQQTDGDIGRQLDRIIKKEQGDILLFLGADHHPFPRKANLIRDPLFSENPLSLLAVWEKSEKVSGEKREEILLRSLVNHYLSLYWIMQGEDMLLVAERLNPILQLLILKDLQKLYNFMTETQQFHEIPTRGYIWLRGRQFM